MQYGDGSASHLEHNSLPNKLLVIPETRIHLSNNNWQTAMGKMSCCSSRSTMKLARLRVRGKDKVAFFTELWNLQEAKLLAILV